MVRRGERKSTTIGLHPASLKTPKSCPTIGEHYTRRFAEQVRSRPGFELAIEPESNIVCFRHVGNETDPDKLDALNTRIRRKLLTDGRFYIVQTTLHGRVWLRVSLMNPLTTDAHLGALLDAVVQ